MVYAFQVMVPSKQATPDMAVSGQEAFGTLRSVSNSELGLPTSKKADGFTETQHEPHAIASCYGMGEALSTGL